MGAAATKGINGTANHVSAIIIPAGNSVVRCNIVLLRKLRISPSSVVALERGVQAPDPFSAASRRHRVEAALHAHQTAMHKVDPSQVPVNFLPNTALPSLSVFQGSISSAD